MRFAAFGYRDFRLFQVARFLLTIGVQMQSVAVGWHVYEMTRRPVDLGYVGLVQFLPLVGLSLLAGHTADRFDRRRVLLVCHVVIALSALALATLTALHVTSLVPMFAVLFVFGSVRAFIGPAAQSLVPFLVPSEELPSAVTLSSAVWQIAAIVGPAAGGLIYAAGGPLAVYITTAIPTLATFGATLLMHVDTGRAEKRGLSLATLFAGVGYVFRTKIILGTISLDLFAVLFGGAVALLPAFARDVLHASPMALGLLRSAPSIGAAVMAATLSVFPLGRHAGAKMLVAVFVFGLATLVFASARSVGVAMGALIVCGAADMVSVVVRSTVIQLATPNEMRGRVSAVNLVFVGASNELGEFESGLTAEWLGVTRAIALGGALTCAVVATWTVVFPSLRRIGRLEDVGVIAE